jgi:hypothetical protein
MPLSLFLTGCAETVDLQTDKSEVWANETATLTCTLTNPGGSMPVSATCDLQLDPGTAASVPANVTIRTPTTNATATFTAGSPPSDTVETVTASWNAYYGWGDPTDSVRITVHPARTSVTGGTGNAVTVIVSPSVSRTPTRTWRFTYVVEVLDANATPPAPTDALTFVATTFAEPVTVSTTAENCTRTDGMLPGSTLQPVTGRGTLVTVRCNGPSAKMTFTAEADADPGGMATFIISTSQGAITVTTTGPQ